jgi:Asp-tRNA(Asn)/Glu-tRNA(Gln) amidotransferase A subunit family amidase
VTEALVALSAVDAVAAMGRGDVTAEAYATALLQRCEAGRALNAFITLDPHRVLDAARQRDLQRRTGGELGPLHGLPIPVKDSINTQDLFTTAGTPALRHFKPREDAPIVRSLIDAGALVLGKTNLHELSFGWTSNNLAFGAVHNPYDPTRIPGGSSGGTAAAVASGMAPLGLAEDTQGSIRVPAALCGIAGFRPTTARYPTAGAVPITALFDQIGPLARSVCDLALFDSVVTGDFSPPGDCRLEGVRLGIDRDYWFSGLDPEVERISGEALRQLEDAGVTLIEVEIPDLARLVSLTTIPIQNHDVRQALSDYLAHHHAGVTFEQVVAGASADIRRDFAIGVMPGGRDFVTPEKYRQAREVHLPALRRRYRECFASTGVTAIVFPTTLVPAPRIGDDADLEVRGQTISFETAIARNIAPGSTAGVPGLVLPAGLTSGGLPVGIEFDGPAGTDRTVLALGVAVERVLGPLPGPRR